MFTLFVPTARATAPTDTYLCSYNEAATEGLLNEMAQRCVDIHEIQLGRFNEQLGAIVKIGLTHRKQPLPVKVRAVFIFRCGQKVELTALSLYPLTRGVFRSRITNDIKAPLPYQAAC